MALVTVALTDNPSGANVASLKNRLITITDELEHDHSVLVDKLLGINFALPRQASEGMKQDLRFAAVQKY